MDFDMINRSATDQIFRVCQVLKKKCYYNGTVHMPVINLKKAYELIRREVLHNIQNKFSIPMEKFSLIKMCLN
jgi:hypothetical protein